MKNKERFFWLFGLIMAIAIPRAWAYSNLSVSYAPPADADALGAVCIERDPCPSSIATDGGSNCTPADFKVYGTMCGISASGEKRCANLSVHVPLTNVAVKTIRGAFFNLGSSVFPQ